MASNAFLCLVFLTIGLTAINAFGDHRIKRLAEGVVPSEDECLKPPMRRNAQECCRLPRERILGDIRHSLNWCFTKVRAERRQMRREMGYTGEEQTATTMTPEEGDSVSVTEGASESTAPRSSTKTPPSTFFRHPGRPQRKLHHSFHHRQKDGCFLECVFQDQGFLINKVVNKDALLRRLNVTLRRNAIWRDVALTAVEKCHQQEFDIPSNKTCRSGSEEIFRCIFKHIFLNCPGWPERNEYCSSLREFYRRCPDGPPPEIEDDHSSPSPAEEQEEETEAEPTTDPPMTTTEEP